MLDYGKREGGGACPVFVLHLHVLPVHMFPSSIVRSLAPLLHPAVLFAVLSAERSSAVTIKQLLRQILELPESASSAVDGIER